MGRPPRIEFAGAIFHVWARRVDRWPLFVDEKDYERYVALLAQAVGRSDWILLSFCLMPNHVHLLIELREPNLSKGMHWLHGKYVRYFNDRHERKGRLFEDRFQSRLVKDELYFLTVSAYIENNPVAASLSDTPEGWHWSSRGLARNGRPPSWVAADVLQERRGELKDGAWHRL